MSFRLAVSSLVGSILDQRFCEGGSARHGDHAELEHPGKIDDPGSAVEKVVQFVLEQHGRMPDYLRLPLAALTVAFDAWAIPTSGRLFHHLPHDRRWQQVLAWKESRLGFRRDLIRFYESLAIFGWYSDVSSVDTRGPSGSANRGCRG